MRSQQPQEIAPRPAPKRNRLLGKLFMAAAACLIAPSAASAQVLDEIELNREDGNAIVNIRLNIPVHYLRHFPADKGDIVEIYFQVLSTAGSRSQLFDETLKSPPTQLVPPFIVTVPGQGDQRLVVQFKRPVDYKVQVGEDNRSLILIIPINQEEDTSAPKRAQPPK